MSDDKFTIEGPPSVEPAAVPPVGTDPIEMLKRRRMTDAVADACLRLLENGAAREDVLTLAIHHYASSLAETRIALAWYVERHRPVMKVSK